MITAEKLTVEFRKTRRTKLRALDDVTLSVPKGSFFALLGENGAGKSTFLYCLLGLLRPTSGTVLIDGQPPILGSKIFERIAYLPEEPHYPGYLTIDEAIDYYAALFDAAVPPQRRTELLDRLGLTPFRNLRIAKCSKGMKQKVGIAQSLLNTPDILFLDEPMRGLDPAGVHEYRDILLEMNRKGATIVMSSHILAEVEAVATDIGILHRGRLAAIGDVASMTRADGESYEVVFETPEPPGWVPEAKAEGNQWRATVAKEMLPGFLSQLHDTRGTLVSSQLKRISLEDRFLSIVREGRADA